MFYCICLFVLALLFYGGQTQECKHGFTYFAKENKCYQVIPARVPWDVAFSICNQLGAHLAVVKDAEANDLLHTAIKPYLFKCMVPYGDTFFWTAGRRTCKNCDVFKWYTGYHTQLDIEFTDWHKGQPHVAGRFEECIELAYYFLGKFGWNDTNCSNLICFICEIDM